MKWSGNIFAALSFFAAILLWPTSPAWAQAAPGSPPGADRIAEAIKSQLPAPPAGFVWRLYKNAVFLKPEQWKEQESSSQMAGIPVTVYAASPEDFSATKQFEMGVTLQIISGPGRIQHTEAKKMALAYLQPLFSTHKKEEILMLERSTRGDFERTFFRYRDAPAGLKPIIVHKFILANNVTDSVHIFSFESPAETWDDNWIKYGTPIFSKVNVMTNVPPN